MSGHNKWSTIKHKKGAADAKRSKVFTKILKEVTVAARMGGGDPTGNPRLRAAIDKARAANLPKDNLERAILKGTGELEGVSYEEIVYEGYGPGGGALIIEVMTDNSNRTVAEIRHMLSKHNGNLGKAGTVTWKFDRKGVITVPADATDEDTLMELSLELGADDIVSEDDSYVIYTEPQELSTVSDGLTEKGITVENSEVQMIPQNTVKLTGKDAEMAWKIYNLLDDHDDVQNVWHDFEIDDEELSRLMN
ncbi:MAG: YebC/PmpR family DNA-binding transcriptional regulator [Deltaproteobacteria bacterium]|nr:YebC/PmpR family DNA-binding transcriptional regulator [Deltaproteobacteria bacterium]